MPSKQRFSIPDLKTAKAFVDALETFLDEADPEEILDCLRDLERLLERRRIDTFVEALTAQVAHRAH